jgi:hypothetical protein
MAELKSLAHPEWPYTGTPHEWRGFTERETILLSPEDHAAFVKALENPPEPNQKLIDLMRGSKAVYQKQNFGPDLK